MLGQRLCALELGFGFRQPRLNFHNLAAGLSDRGVAPIEIGSILLELCVECNGFKNGEDIALLDFIAMIDEQLQYAQSLDFGCDQHVFAWHQRASDKNRLDEVGRGHPTDCDGRGRHGRGFFRLRGAMGDDVQDRLINAGSPDNGSQRGCKAILDYLRTGHSAASSTVGPTGRRPAVCSTGFKSRRMTSTTSGMVFAMSKLRSTALRQKRPSPMTMKTRARAAAS